MKIIKFREVLANLILNGSKTTTWRLFDDKNLIAGDIVSFVIWETGEEFAKARLIDVKETTLGQITEKDLEGHEKFLSDEELYATYSIYYKQPVNKMSSVKIIQFELE
jgi:hypothetical protein